MKIPNVVFQCVIRCLALSFVFSIMPVALEATGLQTPDEHYSKGRQRSSRSDVGISDDSQGHVYFTDGNEFFKDKEDTLIEDIYRDKLKTIVIKKDQIIPIRTAKGYPTVIVFPNTPNDCVLGHPGLFRIQTMKNHVRLFPVPTKGNTTMHVLVGDYTYKFHLIIGNFADAYSEVTLVDRRIPVWDGVSPGITRARFQTNATMPIDLPQTLKIIDNYEALISAGKLSENQVSMIRLGRRSPDMAFVYKKLFAFYYNNQIAVSFTYRNIHNEPRIVDISMLRLMVGRHVWQTGPIEWSHGTGILQSGESAQGVVFIPAHRIQEDDFYDFELVFLKQ